MKFFGEKDDKTANVLFWALVLVSTIGFPEQSHAQNTLGTLVCNIKKNLGALPYIVNVVSYVCATFLMANGVFLLLKHFQNPADSKVTKAVAHFVGGAGLFALPSMTGVLQRSIFPAVSSGGTLSGCNPVAPTGGASGLDTMMLNFVGSIYDPMFNTMAVLGAGIGIFLIAKGIMRASKTGTDPKAASPQVIAANFIIGAILISLTTILDTISSTIFGSATSTAYPGINWSAMGVDASTTAAADNTVKAVIRFIQVIGIIGFFRGWLMIKGVAEGTGQNTIPQGATHIIGGAMAVNIGPMLTIFDDTFGTGLVN